MREIAAFAVAAVQRELVGRHKERILEQTVPDNALTVRRPALTKLDSTIT